MTLFIPYTKMFDNIDLKKLALWRFNQWSPMHVWCCFCDENTPDHRKNYWFDKFERDILSFYMSLDEHNKVIFYHYLVDQLNNYNV